MRAAVLLNKESISVTDVKKPTVAEGEILVKVEACGLCGSDLRIYSKGDARAAYPIILGHEIAGFVDELGPGVTEFKKGDRVTVAPGHGCGECRYCLNNQHNICVKPMPSVGYAYDGGFAEYFLIPKHVLKNGFVNKLPDNLDFVSASLSEPLACCLHAHTLSPVHKDDSVLIFGAGPIGCFHIALSQLAGAKQIILVDINQERLERAGVFKPTLRLNPKTDDVKQAVLNATDGLGVNAVFVAAPAKEAQVLGVELLAPAGRINFFGGLAKDDCKIELDANLVHYKELIVTGSSSSLPADNKKALELLATKQIDAKQFISHEMPLSDIEKGIKLMRGANSAKIIIKPWE